jgi:hypothetical protein
MKIPDLIFENKISDFLTLKYLKILRRRSGSRIRDLVNPGLGMEKVGSGIWDKYPGSATLEDTGR